MDLEKIEKLVKLIDDSSLKRFTYRDGEIKITMSKLDNPPVVSAGAPVSYTAAPVAPAPAAAAAAPAAAATEAQIVEEDLFIVSPIVGTFYVAPAPDADPFVKVGDHVKNGQTVCILEAMKTMNEIASEWDCEILEVLVGNEQKVEYGQQLFRVKRL